MNKAPVLSKDVSDDIIDRNSAHSWWTLIHLVKIAQRDADHKHYQGIIREIFEEIEMSFYNQEPRMIMTRDWQSLKSKYQEES